MSRCGYGTIDPVAETITIDRDWNAPGIASLAGVLHFREYGNYIEELKRGETVVCADVQTDARTREAATALRAISAHSFVNMPITERGGTVAVLYLSNATARTWSTDELAFVREVAERTRIAVERRRSEQAVAADLKDTRLLRDLAARFVAEHDTQALFDEILNVAMTITDADGGTIQLLDEASADLVFVATRGLDPGLISRFDRVDAGSGSPCGLALATGKRSMVRFDAPESDDPDGSLRAHFDYGMLSAQSTPLISRSGRVLGMFSTHWRSIRTLSEREQRFLDLLARQAADVIERMKTEEALRSSEQQLRDADRRKDEYIATLAHELRNPLVPIRTGIELLKKVRERPELLDSIRPMMERQVGHMVRLIDDLLDVARITSGKIELKRERAPLSSVVESAIEANWAAMQAKCLDLSVDLPRPDPVIDVDPTRFAQVISNLVQNAVKFTPAGGRIAVGAAVAVDASSTGSDLVISVTDSGVGISQESLPRIFDLFAQPGTGGQGSQGGLGIGLAIARRLVEMHGGTIEARSDGANQGSTFTIRLRVPRAAASPEASPSSDEQVFQSTRVMIIDDNHDAADAMGLLVEMMGGSVRVAYDGESGVAALQEFQPAMVLLDIGMPGMDGYETCRRIRREFGASMDIVALSGWGQEHVVQLAEEAGFDAHLTKPVEPGKLEELIATLRRRRA